MLAPTNRARLARFALVSLLCTPRRFAEARDRDDRTAASRHNHGSKPKCNEPLLRWFRRTFNSSSSTDVLDVGGGRGAMGAQLRAVLPPSSVVRYDCVDVVASATCASYPGDAIPDERDGSRAVVLFNYVLHHAGDGSTISLLQEARRVSRRWVVVVEDLRGETLDEAELNFAHEWGGVFRGPREWAQLFRLVGLALRETIPIPRDCGFRDLARAVFVLEVR